MKTTFVTLLLLGSLSIASAYTLPGVVTNSSGPAFVNLPPGTPLQVLIEIEPGMQDLDPSDEVGAYYPDLGGSAVLVVDFGTFQVGSSLWLGSPPILVSNTAAGDLFSMSAEGPSDAFFSFGISDSTCTAFDNDDIPDAIIPSRFDSGGLSYSINDSTSYPI